MLALITTLFEIALLRKGPDAIPRSSVVFLIAVGLWLAADLVAVLLSPTSGARQFITGLIIVIPGLLIYVGLARLYAQQSRSLQMLTAMFGSSALLSLLLTIVVAVLLRPTGVAAESGAWPLATIILVWGIVLWSIVVDGHILSRTLNQPRGFGVAIALSVFVVQYYLSTAIFVDNAAGS